LSGTNVPRGEARREAILRSTLAIIGERGPEAVTHRAVAERAGLPLAATTYWFSSKEDLLEQTLVLAGREEVARLERVVLELATRELAVEDWAAAVASTLAWEVEHEPSRHVAFFELVLQAARTPALRAEVARWEEASLRLAEVGLRAAGSPTPEIDARLVVATLTGLVLEQLATPRPRFEDEVLRPTLEHLFARLTAGAAV
jgi:DNA-binding transcriptional regulator YbjK